MYDENLALNSDYTSETYAAPVVSITPITVEGAAAPVVTINGNSGGGAAGPAVTFSGGSTGYEFTATGNSITLTLANAATARAALGAAASGANADINTFSALTGNTGFSAWTGTSDGSSHATYSGTASVAYVQAELQGAMDALKQATEFIKKLVDANIASGVLET
jgi:hypothetical protein